VDSPVVGVVGAGQLARMMQEAAIALGVPLRLLAEHAEGAASQVIVDTEVGDYTDLDVLLAWARHCDVVTFDHEHVPTGHVEALEAAGIGCRPGPGALVHAQDKIVMRKRLAELGVPCPRFAAVCSVEEAAGFADQTGGFPIVLKTPRGGYDGKGVWFVEDVAQVADLLGDYPPGSTFLAEEKVGFRRELSALAVRSASGQLVTYPVVESVQRDGICVEVTAPAPDLPAHLAFEAQSAAQGIAA